LRKLENIKPNPNPTWLTGVHGKGARLKPMSKPCFVHAEWDAEALVWVVAASDVPGLATEAPTVEALVAKLEAMIPELLAANGQSGADPAPFELLARRFETARSAA